MKKTFTKALLALAVACFIFAIAPMIGSDLPGIDPAMTADAATVVSSGACGANLTWELDDEGTLTIAGTGDMADYNYEYRPLWYSNRSSIKKVIIGDGVTSIGDYAFYWCRSLTSVTIPDGVTSIGDYAFYWCSSLTSVTIGDSVTSIGDSAFSECTSLTGITVDVNNEYYAADNGILYNKEKTTLVCYPAGKTETSFVIPDNVTSIGYGAFSYCESLTSVIIGDSVTSIGDRAFYECSSLTSVTIPDSVTSIGDWAFSWCTSLTSVTIPDSVTSIGSYAFYNCTSLTSVIIPNSVTSIGDDAFRNCTSLTSVTIPDSVTSIGDYAFYDCTSLTSVTIGDSVTSIGGRAFYNCTALTSVTIGDSVTSIGGSAFYNCTSLTSVTIPDSVTSIGEGAFCNCTSLTSVTIPDSVTSIEYRAFYKCTSLTSVTIGDSVTSIGGRAFYNCTSLTSVTIGNGVTSIGDYAFYGCTSLTSLTIGNSVTSIGIYAFDNTAYYNDANNWEDHVLYIGNHLIDAKTDITDNYVVKGGTKKIAAYAFDWCAELTSVTIPDSVTSIGDYAFLNCYSLTSVTIPDSVTYLGAAVFRQCDALTDVAFGSDSQLNAINSYAFEGCDSLVSVAIPDTVTAIAYSSFASCTSLSAVTIPDSVNSIGYEAFEDCISLTEINVDAANSEYSSSEGVLFNKEKTTLIQYPAGNARTNYAIPDSVTSISNSAFSGCTALTSVIIPDSVTSIGEYAFYGCPWLTILGYLDSYAQSYAEVHGIPFLALDRDPFVSLYCSSVTPVADITVYGTATPGQMVSFYCDTALLGTARSGGNGRYTIDLHLPEPAEGKIFSLVAKITIDDEEYASETVQVTFDSGTATLQSLDFTHSVYTYSITSGTLNYAAPTISINSSVPMSFVISLNGNPDSLTIVSTKDGERKTMPATYNAVDDKWYVSGWFDTVNKSYTPGTITLEYNNGKVIEVPFKAKFIVDPSGFVYEAVRSNVLEGVVATVLFEDENENVVFWNADEYDQINPQVTKADGYFCWFVPDGQWQVCCLKSGYEATYSDWYEVPPEVTGLYIPMVSYVAPQVEYCNVYKDYAEMKFSKYMQIDTINSETVVLGDYTGTWEAVDKEVSGTDETVYYATTFRFTPDTAFSGEVAVSVSGAMSYADVANADYSTTAVIAEPIEALLVSVCELSVEVGQSGAITIDAGAAAAGKTVTLTVTNASIATVASTITLDENGKAVVAVDAKSFGTTTLQFALSGISLTAQTLVSVTPPAITPEPEFTLGDVDNDGNITSGDARLALRASVGLEELTETQTKAADVDKNNAVTAGDARLILRCAVGLETF